MSTLAGNAEIVSEVNTGARKKTCKVKSLRMGAASVESVRDQMQSLAVHNALTNGTSGNPADTAEDPGGTDVVCPSCDHPQRNSCTEQWTNECTSKLHIIENLEVALEHLEGTIEEHRKASEAAASANKLQQDDVEFVSYESELQMAEIMRLIQKDLSEPYSIYTYRYFIHNWPKLCFLAMHGERCIGAIVCKLDLHRNVRRGYIAMLAVDEKYRKRKIGSKLVRQAIQAMIEDGADEVVLETEITNKPALRLYENLGFVRDKRLFRYYLNGVDALRLKLWLR